jgi:hypothetical protein
MTTTGKNQSATRETCPSDTFSATDSTRTGLTFDGYVSMLRRNILPLSSVRFTDLL